MYDIEWIGIEGEKIFILNEGKKIILYESDSRKFFLYEKSLNSDYKLINLFNVTSLFGIIDSIILSNEMIVTVGRKQIIIYKKDSNSNYILHQNIFGGDWAEIYNIKELSNKNFAVCGWYGFMIFEQNKNSQNYELILEINDSVFNDSHRIYDFLEIKGKENKFILISNDKAFIINSKNIEKIIKLDDEYKSFYRSKNYICQFNDELYIIPGMRVLTFININDNSFKQIKFLKESEIKKQKLLDDTIFNPKIFKYNSKFIILDTLNGLFFVQIINNEKIQVNLKIQFVENIQFFHYIESDKALVYGELSKYYKFKIKKLISLNNN